ncbi:MAG: hypothetical protein KGR98_13150, partial [Verrucomicrobia bacterium]|nr:hypothetical protein [Verrucomicrobiota bacterium]
TLAKSSASAKATGAAGLLGMLMGPLAVILPNYLAYRVALDGAQSDAERARVRSLFGKAGLITLGLFLPFAAVALWMSRNQSDRSFMSGLFATGLVLIYLPTLWICGTSGKRRQNLARILAKEHAGVLPKPAWEFCSQTKWLGLPLVHIRIGDRFSLLKGPVKAWIAMGDRAIGGLFAFGSWAMAPLSIGGFSLGVLSIGGLSAGIFVVGGIALGVWAFFGGLAAGWQAVGGLAIALNAAAGTIALAHDFAIGRFAFAEQINNQLARQSFESHWFCRCALFINEHWLWLNLFWILPFLVLWWMAQKQRKNRSRMLV